MVECALAAYDKEKSVLNECLEKSEANRGSDGGLQCVLETLEACTKQVSVGEYVRSFLSFLYSVEDRGRWRV